MTTPITPSQAAEQLNDSIPDIVFETVNQLIIKHLLLPGRAGRQLHATIQQSEIVDHLVEAGQDRAEIFDNHWLDIDRHYQKAGWKVIYDHPGYNETYSAHFTFSARAPRS